MRRGSCFNRSQTEMSTEEKRQAHQKELAQRINQEARERMKGLGTGNKERK